MSVHPSAVVSSSAKVDDSASIGPFCIVGDHVEIGPECELVGHCVVLGPTRLGARNRVFPFATLGAAPQDLSYRSEPTELLIGDGNTFREGVTVHRGTTKDQGKTVVGSSCLIMAGAHIAHDCHVGSHVVLTNMATLGGHVRVEDAAVLGGHVAVAPLVRVGRAAFLAGGARVERDVPPFMIAAGDRARVRAPNRVGQRRIGIPAASRQALKQAYRMLWGSHGSVANLEQLERLFAEDPWVAELIRFVRREA